MSNIMIPEENAKFSVGQIEDLRLDIDNGLSEGYEYSARRANFGDLFLHLLTQILLVCAVQMIKILI